MEVDSSEDSEPSLSETITSSNSLTPETKLNEYGKSGLTLRSCKSLAMGRKTSQRNSHKPEIFLKIYDAIEFTCEYCQSKDHTSEECSKLFVPASEDFPKFRLKYTCKAINVQGDGNCGYRKVSHYIYKTQVQRADVRGDLAEEIQNNQYLYEAMNTFIPPASSHFDRIEWYEDVGQAPKSKLIPMPDMGGTIAKKY
ncbi:hypothetical protein O181_081179 [Austropuccinia psidii MF-1]|uniref:Ubiquitinyl hydrolase 1 n=1 Tax=Austropuccinia psidii MF-1 TaxID=1389203 RepID=A0A9Q3IJW0_9BASI|nr:hypothetical protein [Austropuccinia psidii MF-1]